MTTAVRHPQTAFPLARRTRGLVRRVPVWTWRLLMLGVSPRERARFNTDPRTDIGYAVDISYAEHGVAAQKLDVLTPLAIAHSSQARHNGALPVYVYFHGGGWTSGDKSALTKYCANQAAGGMVVVNVNYRRPPRFHMGHVLDDANAALAWVRSNIEDYGGDPECVVLGGDSAGGQIAALLAAATFRPELAGHYSLQPAVAADHVKGLVQHCSVVDFSVFFKSGFVMGLNFVRMLLPSRPGNRRRVPFTTKRALERLREEAACMSPIEWLDGRFPPVFVTTSERDFLYEANLNFIARLEEHDVPVDALIYEWSNTNTEHTWQQDYRFAESQEVYRRLHAFVRRVSGPAGDASQ
ncbi:alpha/beta hydrolase [Pseudarthrobacter phenanthrenivorans]|uniref:alpha/beta hydrolase n=1 Tax=Pseudarthrobacter phenanthrenivorans TaxID=361575 RepID=UPI001FE8E2DA|nr:alpha/beta hydrolase [Pseudarthrobacter phenanthrenivorans]